MSTSWYVAIDMPLTAGTDDPAALVRAAFESFPHHANTRHDPTSLDDDLPVLMPSEIDESFSPPRTDPGWEVRDGRLVAEMHATNLQRERDQEDWPWTMADGSPAERQMDVLLDVLTRVCAAPTGTVIGSIRSENAHDASPFAVTPWGVRPLHTHGDSRRDGFWKDDLVVRPPTSFVHPSLMSFTDPERTWTVDVDLGRMRRMWSADPVEAMRAIRELSA